jgi:multisubunit Na+/H+ antiporter MnhB subunit
MKGIPAFFSSVALAGSLLAFLLHVLAVLGVFRPDGALLNVLLCGALFVGAPLLFYGKAWRRRVGEPTPLSALIDWRLARVLIGLGALLAYIVWFHHHVHGPTRWSIPDDPIPPLLGQLTTLVESWMFAFMGTLHYLEMRRMPAAPF